MLSTTEINATVEEALQAFTAARYQSSSQELTNQAHKNYQETIDGLESQWKAWLAEEYAGKVPAEVVDDIYDLAWSIHNADSYEQVEINYQRCVNILEQALNVQER